MRISLSHPIQTVGFVLMTTNSIEKILPFSLSGWTSALFKMKLSLFQILMSPKASVDQISLSEATFTVIIHWTKLEWAFSMTHWVWISFPLLSTKKMSLKELIKKELSIWQMLLMGCLNFPSAKRLRSSSHIHKPPELLPLRIKKLLWTKIFPRQVISFFFSATESDLDLFLRCIRTIKLREGFWTVPSLEPEM